jgi:hypothetical protein
MQHFSWLSGASTLSPYAVETKVQWLHTRRVQVTVRLSALVLCARSELTKLTRTQLAQVSSGVAPLLATSV